MSDWTAIASYLSVGIAVVIFLVLVIRIRKLIYKDDK
jgi:hypothetical protein